MPSLNSISFKITPRGMGFDVYGSPRFVMMITITIKFKFSRRNSWCEHSCLPLWAALFLIGSDRRLTHTTEHQMPHHCFVFLRKSCWKSLAFTITIHKGITHCPTGLRFLGRKTWSPCLPEIMQFGIVIMPFPESTTSDRDCAIGASRPDHL